MFDVQRSFNRLGSKPQHLDILIASKALNTDRDIVKNFSNNWKTKAFRRYRPCCHLLYCPSVAKKLTPFVLEMAGVF
ncbi:hypothetical protein ANSO36C_35510 [Nostoc cf. commune SO-36]|uniref:Uncharacterized protein n=1 Tax=Nostoc cf. commune SO-36 TaxID=449208 RepID=A0ABN6Q797_NOSCO|nr:hypothetical protein ANSO36C_35510 [Nostoc cf. commune SO-36]